MGRRSGYGRRTVEQTRSVDIGDLCRAGYVGKPPANWWVHRSKLDCAGIHPQQWNDDAIGLDRQHLRIAWLPWHFDGRRAYFLCNMPHMANSGAVEAAMH